MVIRRSLVFGFAFAAFASGTLFVDATPAGATASYESTYGFERTWNAAIRMVRVDMGFTVTEKDPQNGYLMFDYKSNEGSGKPTPGSVEFVRGSEDQLVRVVVQLPQMPNYHEKVLLDSLVRKLRQEYGDPPVKARPLPADAGSDSAPSNILP